MSVICPKCSKEFKNEMALRMHDMRTHTGRIKTPGQMGLLSGKKFKQPWSRANSGVVQKWTSEQIELLMVIAEEYYSGSSVSWERAFQEHPEWEADLGNRSRLTLTQKVGYERQKRSQAAPQKPGRWTDDQLRLLLQLDATYRRTDGKNTIDWKRAFEEHPDWRQKLGGRDTFTLSGKISYLRQYPRPDLAPAKAPVQVIQTRPRPRQSVIQAPVVDPGTNGHSVHVSFCPECGAHIKMWNQVADVIKGLPKK